MRFRDTLVASDRRQGGLPHAPVLPRIRVCRLRALFGGIITGAGGTKAKTTLTCIYQTGTIRTTIVYQAPVTRATFGKVRKHFVTFGVVDPGLFGYPTWALKNGNVIAILVNGLGILIDQSQTYEYQMVPLAARNLAAL